MVDLSLRVTDFAFYDDILTNQDGSLAFGKRLKPDEVIIAELFACFVVAGQPGNYKLSIKVWSEGIEIDETPLSFEPRTVVIHKDAVSARAIVPLPIGKLPVGHYVMSVRHDDSELAKFGFDVTEPAK